MGRNCEQSCKSAPDYFHNLPDYLLSVFGSRILTKFSEKYRTKILLITCNFCFSHSLTGSVIFMKLCSVQTPTNLRWHMGLERQKFNATLIIWANYVLSISLWHDWWNGRILDHWDQGFQLDHSFTGSAPRTIATTHIFMLIWEQYYLWIWIVRVCFTSKI